VFKGGIDVRQPLLCFTTPPHLLQITAQTLGSISSKCWHHCFFWVEMMLCTDSLLILSTFLYLSLPPHHCSHWFKKNGKKRLKSFNPCTKCSTQPKTKPPEQREMLPTVVEKRNRNRKRKAVPAVARAIQSL